MRAAIIDCYTDEPSGLGVPPFVGTYPRYIYGALSLEGIEVTYLTIDDLRANMRAPDDIEVPMKTPINVRNRTKQGFHAKEILARSDIVIVIAGVHTPGKYLSAYPGTTKEVSKLLNMLGSVNYSILTGPASVVGSGMWGGTRARKVENDADSFDLISPNIEYKIHELMENNFSEDVFSLPSYDILAPIAIEGAKIVSQLPHHPSFHIAEIETMSGCRKLPPCSFCTEQIKHEGVIRRDPIDIIKEVRALAREGLSNIRLGKQTCFFSYGSTEELQSLLKPLSMLCNVLHIDNANPLYVTQDKVNVIANYCTEGNVASFGVESFDTNVIEKNDLGTSPELILEKIRIINEVGAKRGINGMPKILPGINLLFGLIGEKAKTHEENMLWLSRILDEKLLLRRINIREVVVFPGTKLEKEAGNKFLRKNSKRYWKWRNEIRHSIDLPMLQRLVPKGTVMRNLRTEIYDGKTTFARQVGSYPLVVGIPGRLGLDKTINIKVDSHMLRSVVGSVVE